MNLNINITRCVIASTIVYTVCLLITIFYQLFKISIGIPFLIFSEAAYIIPIIYMTWILRYLHEKPAIITVYIIYILADLIFLGWFMLFPPKDNVLLIHFFTRILAIAITIGTLIYSLQIQTKSIGTPFSVYWVGLLGVLFFKLIGLVLRIQHWSVLVYELGLISELVLPICMFYVWARVLKYIQEEKRINSAIAEFGNSDSKAP